MGEAMSAKDIERADFAVALRGYDREEVDAFLRQVAGEHRRLSEALDASQRNVDKPYQSLGSDMGELLQHAKDSADAIRRRAEEDGKQVRQEAKKDAAATREKAEHDAEGVRKAADYEASERIKEAERRARQLMEVEAEARHRLRDIRAELATVVEGMERAEASLAQPQGAPRSDASAQTDDAAPTASGGAAAEPLEEPEKSPAA